MKLLELTAFESTYIVEDTNHVNEARADKPAAARNKYYTLPKLKEVLTIAARSLSQYRNKGRFAITFKNDNGRTSALLVVLSASTLTIITALYNTKRSVNNVFYGVPHYYLNGFTFVRPTSKELRDEFHRINDAVIKTVVKPQRNRIRKVNTKSKSSDTSSSLFTTSQRGVRKARWQ